jgi:hypothetical protein
MGALCGLSSDALAIGVNSYIPIFAYDQTNQKLYFFDSANNPVLLCVDSAGVCTYPVPFTITNGLTVDANGRVLFKSTSVPTISSGTCTVASGNDNAHALTFTGGTNCMVLFGTAFAVAPVCVATSIATTISFNFNPAPSTTGYSLNSSGAMGGGQGAEVLCIGK